ncbi:unnamed protein product [Prorocentrum cordatum]|uniref:Uncharacterized protein n=1 Tax=Prorocentrum cordatum TaxID=2364126 RepID=A0ABN9UXQ1_9DINO|nr:unnamed protein product [Polarella glacialis]
MRLLNTAMPSFAATGVLARIEEALTKLDGRGPMEQDVGHCVESGSTTAAAAPARAPESWDPSQRSSKGCRGTRRAASARRPTSRTPQATAHVTPCGDDGRCGARGAYEDTPRIFSTGRGHTPRARPASGSAALSPRQCVERLTGRGTWRCPEVWA